MTDATLLRYCRARKFEFNDITTMLKNSFEWRKENKLDTVIEDFQFEEKKDVL